MSPLPGSIARALVVAALAALAGCGGGEPAHAPDGHVHGAGHEHGHEHEPIPPAGAIISVGLNGKHVDVTIAELPHEGDTVSLAAVWGKAFPGQDTQTLEFDLVGSDGFHVGSQPACKRLLSGAEATSGTLDVKTHDVRFDPSIGLAHCYQVKAVVRIEGTDKK